MENVEIVRQFLAIQGNGDGCAYDDGYGCGDGYGSGNGDIYGHGYGDGEGCGCGFSDGSGCSGGSGYSYGFGSGYGSGNGHGSGSGNASGYGDADIKSINGERVWLIDRVPTLIDRVRGNYAKGRIIRSDLTFEPCYIARVDNSFAHGTTLRKAMEDATEKAIENMPIERRIEKFVSEFPSLETKAKCEDFYNWHHILTGSCEMGRKEFVAEHSLDMQKEYTVRYFLDITEKAYGKEIIKQLKECYESK